MVPVLLLITGLIIYCLLSLSRADPVLQMIPADYTQEEYNAMYIRLGLDKPVPVQYLSWIKNALQGNFGISYNTREPVLDVVAKRIPISIGLSMVTTLAVVILGIPFGVLCAVKQYSYFDNITNVISKILGAVPGFWLGMVFILIFAQKLRLFPTFGFTTAKHWVMPVVVQLLPFTAGFIRQTRSSMLDCIRQDYVRTSRSKGQTESKVIFRDTLRNALLPVITMIGNNFAVITSGSVLIERIFAIPGIGSKILEAISNKDTPVIIFCSMFITALVATMNLIVDLCYAVADPRIKATFLRGNKRLLRAA
jgi:peptide/nickel transport system permease protein